MESQASPLWPGVSLAVGAAILFGITAPMSKLMLGEIDPWMLAGVLYLGAGLGLGAAHWGRRVVGLPSVEAPLRQGDLPWLVLVVLFGGLLGPVMLMLGLSRTDAATGSLLLNLESIATMGIAWTLFRENVDRRLILGAACILVGAVTLSWQDGALHLDLGGLLIAGACLCWGIDNNLTRKLSAADPVQIAMVKGLVAGATNIALAAALGAPAPGIGPILSGGMLGLIGVGLSLVCFMLGLRHPGAARTGAYFSLAPFIGAAVAIMVLGEAMTAQFLVAGGLMAFGVWLHLTERHDHWHEHEALEHEHLHVHDAHHQHEHERPLTEPHSHMHRHKPLRHKHPHYPDLHHRHGHSH